MPMAQRMVSMMTTMRVVSKSMEPRPKKRRKFRLHPLASTQRKSRQLQHQMRSSLLTKPLRASLQVLGMLTLLQLSSTKEAAQMKSGNSRMTTITIMAAK